MHLNTKMVLYRYTVQPNNVSVKNTSIEFRREESIHSCIELSKIIALSRKASAVYTIVILLI